MTPTVWQYDFSSVNGEGWGSFVLRSDGYFSAVTDFGNYAYRWLNHGHDDFREFWLENRWDYPSYIVSKFTNPMHYQSAKSRKAAERQCEAFCKHMLPRLAAAIRVEKSGVRAMTAREEEGA